MNEGTKKQPKAFTKAFKTDSRGELRNAFHPRNSAATGTGDAGAFMLPSKPGDWWRA